SGEFPKKTMTTCNLCNAKIPEGKECKDLFYELTFYTLNQDPEYFIHQLIVDAYGAQHITKDTKPVAVGATLLGLYLFAEHNYTGKGIQKAHIDLGSKMRELPTITIPEKKA